MYLDELNQNFPVRQKPAQKSAFREYVAAEAGKNGFAARTETNEKHDNIIIGDPETAKVVFTAHYDTPRRALLPNIMLPTHRALYYAYNFGMVLIMVAFAFGSSYLLVKLAGVDLAKKTDRLCWVLAYAVIYYALFRLVLMGAPNKFNYNDNTSGTAAVLELAKRFAGDERAAFILFDDEEKGKKGSKAYAKAHPEIKKNTLIVNLDCVGNGKSFLACATEKAKNCAAFPAFERAFTGENGYEARVFDAKRIAMNSDQKSFDAGVGVCACLTHRRIGYFTPNIHTGRDVVVSNENIGYICRRLSEFVNNL